MWFVTRSKLMGNLNICPSFPVQEQVAYEKKTTPSNQIVHWDNFKVIAIGDPTPATFALSSCFALCARGYNKSGVLTHLGMAHWFHKNEFVASFFEALRQQIEGKIELFIAGGEEPERALAILKQAKEQNIEVVHDVSLKLSRQLIISQPNEDCYYPGSVFIQSVWFNNDAQPCLELGLTLRLREEKLLEFLSIAKEGKQIDVEFVEDEPDYQVLQENNTEVEDLETSSIAKLHF